jgi:hypothetical protein
LVELRRVELERYAVTTTEDEFLALPRRLPVVVGEVFPSRG